MEPASQPIPDKIDTVADGPLVGPITREEESPDFLPNERTDIAAPRVKPSAGTLTQPAGILEKIRSKKPVDEHCLLLLRHLRSHVAAEDSQSIGITSCCVGEGVSSISANVAICAARVGVAPVLLVEAHANRPKLSRRFGVSASPGLCDILSQRRSVSECIQQTKVDNLSLLVAGADRHAMFNAYNSATLEQVLTELKQQFLLVVFDLPPANEQSSCFATSAALDGVVLVIESEKIRSKVVQRAKEHFERANIELLGAVLNKRREHIPNWLYRRL